MMPWLEMNVFRVVESTCINSIFFPSWDSFFFYKRAKLHMTRFSWARRMMEHLILHPFIHLVRVLNHTTITISSIWNLITMGKTDFFHRGQNYLIYTSKYLQNTGDFGEKSGTKFSTSYLWSYVTATNP